jgi:hypothetical protein
LIVNLRTGDEFDLRCRYTLKPLRRFRGAGFALLAAPDLPAEFGVVVHDGDARFALFGGKCSRQARRAAANHQHVVIIA